MRVCYAGISALAFAPHGTMLASTGRDLIVRVWDIRSGKELFSIKDDLQAVGALAFDPSGKTLAVAGLVGNGRTEAVLFSGDLPVEDE